MKKPVIRMIALLIAFMLVLGMCSGVLAMFAGAAGTVNFKNGSMGFVRTGTNSYTVTFDFSDANVTKAVTDLIVSPATNTNINFSQATSTLTQDSNDKSLFHVTIKNAVIPTPQSITFEFTAQYTVTAAGDGGGNGYASGYVGSSDSGDQYIAQVLTADTTVSKTMTTGNVSTGLKITFYFLDPGIDFLEAEYSASDFTMPLDSVFGWSHNTKLVITEDSRGGFFKATLSNVSYNGGNAQNLILTLLNENFVINVPIPGKYFKKGSSGDEDAAPVSDIVVQSTIVRNAQGQKLGKVDKDSGQFTVEITFYDIGLKGESDAAIDDAKKYAFITTPTGFKLHKGSTGTVERVASSAEYPRFKATFEAVSSTGTVNTLNFRVQYDFAEYAQSVKGESIATLFQIDSESSKDEDEEVAPLKPNVIVQEYSYGEEAIVAGSEFNLDLVFTNTSRDVAVENVVMTIEPASGFYIAAASNTVYFPSMAAGESKPYSVALRAMPSQNAGVAGQNPTDYSVTIKFSYQYLSKKEYAPGETSVKIAIPVEQLDRFTVDEITDYTQYLTVGYEGYLSVPITNKGKSATMNISGTVESKNGAEFTAPPVHYGNLEAGKSATMNISITVTTPGEFQGEAVILYEDENMNQKEVRQPFTIMVEAPMTPQPEFPQTPDMQPQNDKLSPYSVVLIVIGGLMLASPAAMILMKRIKARGNEDFDEDF